MITADELCRVVLSLPEAEEHETWVTQPSGSRRPGSRRPWAGTRREPAPPPPAAPETFGVAAYDADQDAREPGSDALDRAGDNPRGRAAENRGLAAGRATGRP
jgi:hypothetical protein